MIELKLDNELTIELRSILPSYGSTAMKQKSAIIGAFAITFLFSLAMGMVGLSAMGIIK